MIRIKNEIFRGSNNRASLIDISIPENFNNKICFFTHGYKGFKDWGGWNMIEKEFVKQGYGFVKFNLSHNGGTVTNPIDFPDLEAFAENNYSKEIFDIKVVLENFRLNFPFLWENSKKILIGHSRGGADVILACSQLDCIDGLATWASISNIENRFPKGEELERWQNDGIRFVENARTNQKMPHKIQFYQDFITNKDVLNIEKSAKAISCPWIILHGEDDQAVLVEEAEKLNEWSGAKMKILPNTGHTFDTKHPMDNTFLPNSAKLLVDLTIEFLDQL